MITLQHFPFRRETKTTTKDTRPPVCVVIVSNTRSCYVFRKEFKTWDDARAYRDKRMVGGSMYRVEIKPL